MSFKLDLRKVYAILVETVGADPADELQFVLAHEDRNCSEYRFCGLLGFGGKYRIERNAVDYYPEDKTAERDRAVLRANTALAELAKHK